MRSFKMFAWGLCALVIVGCGGGGGSGSPAATNTAPISNAGLDQTISTGVTVTLDGSGSSDANGDTLSYSWTLTPPAGSGCILANETTATPSFVTDVDGSYTVQLIVNDGVVDSAADTIVVTATTGNIEPVANAGADQVVSTGASVTLDGSASTDANSNPLTYAWSIINKPAGSITSIANATSVNASFIPDLDGSYTVQLIVNDGMVDSGADTMLVTAATGNIEPVADAGADQSIATGATVNLDGSGSSDANGDTLIYAWSMTSKPVGSITSVANATSVNASFISDVDGSYTVQLIVNDGMVDSAADTMVVTATTVANNTAPIPNAGPDKAVIIGKSVNFDGSASFDADGDTLTHVWSIAGKPIGSSASILNATSAIASLAPDVAGSYTIQLIVNDSTVDSSADIMVISAFTLTSPVPDTGQIFDYTITFGEDSDYTINPPSYTDNGDGTVTDNVTGLMWQQQDDDTTYNWYEASGTFYPGLNPYDPADPVIDVCGSLTLGGYTDWRLPTSKRELITIVDYGVYGPAIDTTAFPGTNLNFYWAGIDYYTGMVDFINGDANRTQTKSDSFYVRCVR